MDFIYEWIEQLFEKLPISKENKKLKGAFIAEIKSEYDEFKKENTDEESIEILKSKYEWIYNFNQAEGTPGIFLSVDGMTLSNTGIVFEPSMEEYKSDRTYQLMEELCGISLCYERKKEDFKFECTELFVVFAIDKYRNYFGFIGEDYSLGESAGPIGYVRREGLYGKIANNLIEFLGLVVFYPYWYHVIERERNKEKYTLEKLEQEWIVNIPDFYEKQKELSDALKLHKNDKSLDILFKNLRSESNFVVSNIDSEYNNYKRLF